MQSNETALLAACAVCGSTLVILVVYWLFGCAQYFLRYVLFYYKNN